MSGSPGWKFQKSPSPLLLRDLQTGHPEKEGPTGLALTGTGRTGTGLVEEKRWKTHVGEAM